MTYRELYDQIKHLPYLKKGKTETRVDPHHMLILWEEGGDHVIVWPRGFDTVVASSWDVHDITDLGQRGLLPESVVPVLVSMRNTTRYRLSGSMNSEIQP